MSEDFGLPVVVPGDWPARLEITKLWRHKGGRHCAYFNLTYGGVSLPSGVLVEKDDGSRFVAGPSEARNVRGSSKRLTFWFLPREMAEAVKVTVEGILGID
jgi:hypothetical protein